MELGGGRGANARPRPATLLVRLAQLKPFVRAAEKHRESESGAPGGARRGGLLLTAVAPAAAAAVCDTGVTHCVPARVNNIRSELVKLSASNYRRGS